MRAPAVQRPRGFVVLTALVALLILMIVAGLFLQFGIQSMRREHMQSLSAQCDQIEMSLRALSRRNPERLGGELRVVAIAELLMPGAEGTALLGLATSPDGKQRVRCQIVLEFGADRLDRTIEWLPPKMLNIRHPGFWGS